MAKKILCIICGGIIVSGIFGLFWHFLQKEEVFASLTDNTSGWAWSSNIGWVSFNCTDPATCPPPAAKINYGVRVDPNTGDFSGFAWSNNIGWITMDPAGPYPEGPQYAACMDRPGPGQVCNGVGDHTVSGWMRACVAISQSCTNFNPSGGIDIIDDIAVGSGEYFYVVGYWDPPTHPAETRWRIEKRDKNTGQADCSFDWGIAGKCSLQDSPTGAGASQATSVKLSGAGLGELNVAGVDVDKAPGVSQWWIKKFNASFGSPISSSFLGVADPGKGIPTDMAVDPLLGAAKAYVVGTWGSGGSAMWRAMDNSGVSILSGPATLGRANAVALDSVFPFDIFIGGSRPTGGGGSWWRIEKRKTGGGLVSAFGGGTGWVQRGSMDGTGRAVHGIALDGSDLYAVGVVGGAWTIEKRDTTTGALDSTFGGGTGFVTSVSGGDPEEVTVDTASLYIVGYVPGSFGKPQWRFEKRDKITGDLVAVFSGGAVESDPSPETDAPRAVDLDIPNNFVYAAGYENLNLTPPPADTKWRVEKRDMTTGAYFGYDTTPVDTGGWDGWIKLRGTTTSGDPYGVSWNPSGVNDQELQGWAWGGDVVGWLSFNCVTDSTCVPANDHFVKVSFGTPPSADNFLVDPASSVTYCFQSYPPVRVSWDFVDPDVGDAQDDYHIQAFESGVLVVDTCNCDENLNGFRDSIKDCGGDDTTTPVVTTGLNTCALGNASEEYSFGESARLLDWGKTYSFNLWVKDTNNLWSVSPATASFLTPLHRYPDPRDFVHMPVAVKTGDSAQFCDDEGCPGGTTFAPGSISQEWGWDMDQGDGSPTCEPLPGGSPPPPFGACDYSVEDPTHTFSSAKKYIVTLFAKDDVGMCSAEKTINVSSSSSRWREVSPF